MSRKQFIIKKGKENFSPTREESDELQMILDRLAVQDPEGESFEGYLHSLRNLFPEDRCWGPCSSTV